MIAAALRGIAEHLSAAAGMDLRMLDASRLRWVVEARCRVLLLADAAVYAEYLASAPDEIGLLIEETIVPETRFFRDAAVFAHLRRWVPETAAAAQGPLRVLSAPCSTGQEAYSVAATLQQAGVREFAVTAVDLSEAALEVARRGVYAEQALRGLPAEQRDACGRRDGAQWRMHAELRERIRFVRVNLAEPGALGVERYHLILCRNLLLYLRPEARGALAASLAGALLPGGRLVLGSADHGVELDALFAPVKPAASFAYSRRVPVGVAEVVVARKNVAAVTALPVKVRTAGEVEPTAAALYRAAVEHQREGEAERAEVRCRQSLYLAPGYLPALELLERLWLDLPDQRLRRALAARIDRNRAQDAGERRV